MSYVDVAIPGVIGFLLLALPGLFTKATGDAQKDAGRAAKMRGIGLLLLLVAIGYFFVKMASAG